MARNNQNQAARERGCSASFPMIPLIVIILAQVGTSSDNAALGIAVQELVGALGATVADVQMANLAYSLVAGSCMIAGGMIGVVVGWRKTLRIGLALAILGEAVVVTATSMDVFTWGGRFLVGLAPASSPRRCWGSSRRCTRGMRAPRPSASWRRPRPCPLSCPFRSAFFWTLLAFALRSA